MWDEAKRDAQELLERVCSEKYEARLRYHQICQAPNAEELARADASALRILALEEHDNRLAEIWKDILRELDAILKDEETKATCE